MKDDRLISLNAAIELVCTEGTRLERNGTVAMAEIKQWCVDLLEALPSAQPGWIPWDSGKFPEESGCYIVTAYDGSGSRVTFAKYQKRLKRWELTGARAYWRVLAWQPLPIPYREGGKETDGEA